MFKLDLSFIKNKISQGESNSNVNEDLECLIEAGKVLKERRLLLGLSKDRLSKITKVSVVVIEAIEEGWINQIPEKAYLLKMLTILEKQLGLSQNTLQALINIKEIKKEMRIKSKFTIGSVEVFGTWQGSLIYCMVMIVSIFLINRHQEILSIMNTNTIEPLELIQRKSNN